MIDGGDLVKSDEVCKMFNVSKATLKSFENAGLFDDINVVDGDINYSDDDIERLSMIISLKKIGLKKDMIADFINSKNKNNHLSILKKQRQIILDNIHLQQKNLDIIDFLIYQLTKNN